VVCGAIKWLILEKQKPDGLFQEDAPVIHKEMVGGYHGAEPSVSLTAFVLSALQESQKICKNYVKSLDGSISKASDYLSRKYQALARPYTVALTSYALALTGKLNSEKVLMKFSKDGTHWAERNAHTYNIEGTSYALLALLQMEKSELTGPVARWLAQQNYFGGGYGSTQATILVFQALAQYHVAQPRQSELNLDVSVLLPRRANAVTYRIESSNALVARSAEVRRRVTLSPVSPWSLVSSLLMPLQSLVSPWSLVSSLLMLLQPLVSPLSSLLMPLQPFMSPLSPVSSLSLMPLQPLVSSLSPVSCLSLMLLQPFVSPLSPVSSLSLMPLQPLASPQSPVSSLMMPLEPFMSPWSPVSSLLMPLQPFMSP
ncbi:venom factor-like, partial [Lagopus leucura]|uniref:venom factor-like n=1 Tax=Lagopus leucura TaxID=30410 RepID=UPI001C6728AB